MVHSGKNTAVLGLGHSGEAAAILLLEEGACVTVCESVDSTIMRQKAAHLERRGARVLFGSAAESDSTAYDLVVLSPGIDPSAPLVQNILKKSIPVIGELELAYEECLCPTVAITGTNGKTTTTELTTHILAGAGLRTMASGNIGLPFATAVRESHLLDVMVLEVSSFQLETIRSFRPKIAAWLNLSPNHLDRYTELEDYRAAKLRIFENQKPDDWAVVNALAELPELPARRLTFSAKTSAADFTLDGNAICFRGDKIIDQSSTLLPGNHNAENIMAALAIGYALDLDLETLALAIGKYAPPTHRCEFVRELDGVRWINDSKATNLDAMEMAIHSQQGQLILIAGGKDKGFTFDSIAPLVAERSRTAILIGEMKERISASWKKTECHTIGTLEEAIHLAHRISRPGDTVLFSPGTSSFDMFLNYGERGNLFKSFVQQLNPHPTENP
jgi:UDP-N-acetylmuramoylalanine--D-glutamate ligase